MKSEFIKSICFTLLLSITFFSCDSTNSGSNSETPPEIPPKESMKVDFSEMEESQAKARKKALNGANFTTAFVASTVIKVILEANLFIPRTLIATAQQHEPEVVASSEWEWNYSTTTNGNTYGVKLTAETNSQSDVNWRFFVTNSAFTTPLDNKLFFMGTSDFEATSGTWTYFDLSSTTNEEVSIVTWSKTDAMTSVVLEVTSNRNSNLGDTIEYDFDGTVKKVAYNDISASKMTTISFNTVTNAGFIISPDYNNGEKSCWDEDYQDANCPTAS